MNRIQKLPAGVWITLALLAASIEPIVAKFAFQSNATAIQLILLKNSLGALFMLPFLKRILAEEADAVRRFAPAGVLLFATNSLTLVSLQSLSVVLLITIVTTVPALVALLNRVLGRDQLSYSFWAGFLMCFAGIVLTLEYKDINANAAGIICAFAAAISSTFYRVRMEILCEKHNPSSAAIVSYTTQGVLSLFLVPWALPVTGTTLAYGSWIAVSAALANLAFIYALNLVGSTRISVLTMVQRPLLILAAAILLHETLSLIQIAGVVLVMVGINFARVTRTKDCSQGSSLEVSDQKV